MLPKRFGFKKSGSDDKKNTIPAKPVVKSTWKKTTEAKTIAAKPLSGGVSAFGAQVTDEQLRRYADLIYRRTGIRISPQKKTLLSNRLRRRLRETGIKGYDEYFQYLTSLKPDDPEWDGFLQEITTHETYLFRDEAQWNWFRKQFLPEMEARAKKTGRRQLRIWSAACSTGDEAMTIATCIAASLPNFQRWNIRILGTDIGIGAVEQAKTAVFNERAMRLVPEELRKRYFTQVPNASVWKAKPVLTSMASFRQHNLLDPLVNEGPFDIVFLKNVLIYFDTESKKRVIGNVTKVIREGGYLVAGAAEGISDLVRSFQRLQPWLYRVPEAKEKSSSPAKKTTYSFLKK